MQCYSVLSSTNSASFLKSTGDIPAFRLKNFPKEDWSEKLRVAAISCTESLEWVNKLRASLNNISKMKSLTL
ncbi:unknown [Bacteroides intestinalis CAG:315]|nr:unknown [Bacteroides intestinalis CAG:315]